MYQELAVGYSVMSPQSLTCCTQPASATGVGSTTSKPASRMCCRQSLIHSTCCSMETVMFESTEGLPGPVIMKRFGNPTEVRPR